jgi:hypothetical protein
MMRTTVSIGDEVLEAARSIARSTGETVGEVLTELALRTLILDEEQGPYDPEMGIHLLPPVRRSTPLTTEEIIRIQDETE